MQEQCALTDGELRFGPDPEKLRRFVFQAVVMIGGQSFERRPLLTAVMNELPFVFANRAARRRVDSRIELRSTLDADEIFHRGQLISVCEVDRALRRSMADNVWFAA